MNLLGMIMYCAVCKKMSLFRFVLKYLEVKAVISAISSKIFQQVKKGIKYRKYKDNCFTIHDTILSVFT